MRVGRGVSRQGHELLWHVFFPPTGRLRSIYRSKAREILYKICANRDGMLFSFCKIQLAIQSKKITPRGSSNMSCEGNSLSSKCTERCFLYKEKLIHHHSHTKSWKSELQQFLLQYSSIPPGTSACVCRACELSLKNGQKGKYMGTYIPRWVKMNKAKNKAACCIPGCTSVSTSTCSFASL